MRKKIFKKQYIAVLDGKIEQRSSTICAPIARKKDSIIERCVNFESGDIAVTHYNVVRTSDKFSLVEFLLETGRTHQIRVHSAFIGHPIIGDTLYGTPSNLISRQALHAQSVCFIHPIIHKNLNFCSDIPQDMRIFF